MQEQLAFPLDSEMWKSRNGNWHIQIKMPSAISTEERLLIQCLLGSDLKRELLNFTRWKLKGDDMSCLFKPKQKMLEPAKEQEKESSHQ